MAITAAGLAAALAFSFSQNSSRVPRACCLRSSVKAEKVSGEQSTARSSASFARARSTSRSRSSRDTSFIFGSYARSACRAALRCFFGFPTDRVLESFHNVARNILQTFPVEAALFGSILELFAGFHCGSAQLIAKSRRSFGHLVGHWPEGIPFQSRRRERRCKCDTG